MSEYYGHPGRKECWEVDDRIAELEAELAEWKDTTLKNGELAIRNFDATVELRNRAEKAEAEVERLKADRSPGWYFWTGRDWLTDEDERGGRESGGEKPSEDIQVAKGVAPTAANPAAPSLSARKATRKKSSLLYEAVEAACKERDEG